MLSRYWRIIGVSAAIMIIFSAFMVLTIGYMGIKDPYARIVTGKALSLFALAIFGQSEALKIYLYNHQTRGLGIFSFLNQLGAGLAIIVALLLIKKIYSIESGHPIMESAYVEQNGLPWINALINPLIKHSEVTSLSPLFFFAGINLLLWLQKKGAEEIGRVCFVLSDIPVLLPMMAAILLIALIGGYGSDAYKLLVGGATIMLIFSSIILTECTKVTRNK